MSEAVGESRSSFESTTGGVMTVEAGAVTGHLELRTYFDASGLHARVRYAGAEEWYTVEGSPLVRERLAPGAAPREAHERALACLKTPGPLVAGNEAPASLSRLAPHPGMRKEAH